MNESIYKKSITVAGILAITLPTIFMTLVQASYSMIDGMFIANILGDEALSSLTLISPYFNFFIAIGAMFASGGSAVVMKKMGERKEQEARQNFTALTLVQPEWDDFQQRVFVVDKTACRHFWRSAVCNRAVSRISFCL